MSGSGDESAADEDGETAGEYTGGLATEPEELEPQPFDPDDLGPEVPSPPDYSEVDPDPEVSRRFWALVAVFNVALLALSLGAMFVVFEGNLSLGGQFLLAGAGLTLFGAYRYRQAKRALANRGEGAAGDD